MNSSIASLVLTMWGSYLGLRWPIRTRDSLNLLNLNPKVLRAKEVISCGLMGETIVITLGSYQSVKPRNITRLGRISPPARNKKEFEH